MHAEAWHWLDTQVRPLLADAPRVADLGGLDVNGSPRSLFAARCEYLVVDVRAGPGVHIVADAGRWLPPRELRASFDVALATEVFEHTPDWSAILYNLWLLLRPGGTCLVTCATAPRRAHSVDGVEPPPPGEWYANVAPDALRDVMGMLFREIDLRTHPRGDLYVRGRR